MSDDAPVEDSASRALVVDLDGTLIKSDMLFESFFLLLRQRPAVALLAPLWLLGGRARLKREIATRVELDAEWLPYNAEVIDYLEQARADGRFVVLATATDAALADRVAAHLDLFDEVWASDGQTNLKGSNKLARMLEHFGDAGFEYIGDTHADLPIWRAAAAASVVAGGARRRQLENKNGAFDRVFEHERRPWRALIKALRPHQWSKNLLIPLPVIFAHQISDTERVVHVVLAFIAFSLCASSVYIVNDLLDLEADRQHTRKRNRPFASGDLPLPFGILLAPTLLVCSVGLAWFGVSAALAEVLLAYYALTLAYSVRLKRIAVLDVIVLSGLYIVRLHGGAVAADVSVSFWLSAFSLFAFVDLALIKRYIEIAALPENVTAAAGRGYDRRDLPQLASLGAAAGYVSVLVLALYVNSEQVTSLYSRPDLLWGVLPLVLYWVSRLWILVGRDEMHDDPIVFAIKDFTSYLLAVGVALLALLAR